MTTAGIKASLTCSITNTDVAAGASIGAHQVVVCAISTEAALTSNTEFLEWDNTTWTEADNVAAEDQNASANDQPPFCKF